MGEAYGGRMVSEMFGFADRFMDERAALDPIEATALGVPGFDHLFPDYSPAGYAAVADFVRRSLAVVRTLPVTNDDDRLARDVMIERGQANLALHDVGDWMHVFRPFNAPASDIRLAFDIMAKNSEQDWANVAARLRAVRGALAAARETCEYGRAHQVISSRRVALRVADQCDEIVATSWFSDDLVRAAHSIDLPARLRTDLESGAADATAAYVEFSAYIRHDYTPAATERDGCGPERYRAAMLSALGADFDPQESYDWAWRHFNDLRGDIDATCAAIRPGASLVEICAELDGDPLLNAPSAEEFRQWIQDRVDEAIERSKEHFDITAAMDRCDVRLTPPGSSAAAYYVPPTEDFSRPGTTYFPISPEGRYPTWSEISTCYHESVPGHHLQIAYTLTRSESLSRFQRASFVDGHGEGWAMYAERLADELGWFTTPALRLGYLTSQMLRSVRVIVDIGMHLGYRVPSGTVLQDGTPFAPGEVWTYDLALKFVMSETGLDATFLASEVSRYLAIPAQAISYKVGEREWLQTRAETEARLGARFNLRAFHTYALGLGPVGLNQLRAELARFEG
jgi:uncharacterized protein (DUF885 family)